MDALRAAVGERHCLTDPDLRASYETDWTRRFTGRALAVVRPGTVDQVAGVLRSCADAGVGVVPQGGNTGLVGGSVPRGGEVVLSLRRLDDLGPVDAVAGEVTVGAGATLASVQAHVREAGWEFGVDLAARDSATIGGMVATNAGGEHVLRYGPMRRQLLGLEAVLADGSIVRDGAPYDLADLLCGSEGTLAVVTRVRLRLVPSLSHRSVAVLGLPTADAAVEAVVHLRLTLASLLALELFTDAGLDLVRRHTGVEPPFATEYAAYLLAEAATASGDPTDELAAAVDAIGAPDAVLASDEAGRHRLWQLRERQTEAINAEGVPHKLDVTVALARYSELVARVPEVVGEVVPSARTIVFGHIGEGSLHVNVLGAPPEDESVDDAVLGLVLELGGSIGAEHGIGVAKARWLARSRGAADIAAMRRIKDALDPRGILNPGVILSLR